MTRIESIQHRIHVRKSNRARKHKLKQGYKARREARAIQKLRATLDHLRSAPRVMFDDTSVDLIPKNAKAVAGYTSGLYPTFPTLVKLFPKARRVSIAVASSEYADVLDIEAGDATNADAAPWFYRKATNRGFYTSASNAAALISALAAAGVRRDRYTLWTAHYDGTRHVCSPKSCGYPAAEGTQWTDRSNNLSLDESKLKASFWSAR